MTTVTEVADGVHLVHHSLVNWVLLTDGGAVTVIDTGYPGLHDEVVASIRQVGHEPADVAAILITHAHIDHTGGAERLSAVTGAPVLVHPLELAHARGEEHHALTPVGLAANLWRPRVLPWTLAALRVGVAQTQGVADAQAFPSAGALDVPGHPVPVLTPGHTPGHTVYHLPEHGVVITGDALVTGHPASSVTGPQLLPRMFDHDRAGTVKALETIGALDASIVLPGHGPAHHGPVREATELSAARA